MATYGTWSAERELGKGGQGTVYLAKDSRSQLDSKAFRNELRETVSALIGIIDEPGLDLYADRFSGLVRQITNIDLAPAGALKVLHAFENEQVAAKAIARMEVELDALRRVSHPALIKLLETNANERWFVMEYFPRGPLSNSLADTQSNVPEALRRFRPLVQAAAALHAEKIVHRDIKPENIFLKEDGQLVLGDFGLAIQMDDRQRLTDTYENAGSRDWMPAWAMGMRLDQVTPTFDVFSLGKVLWAMVSGKTKLRLWYHRKRDFELALMFPKNELIPWVQEILDKTVVEDESGCLANAVELLELVDRALEGIQVGGRSLLFGPDRRCRVCGIGRYTMRLDNKSPSEARNFGLSPAGGRSFKAFACGHCGHVDLFLFEEHPRPGWIR